MLPVQNQLDVPRFISRVFTDMSGRRFRLLFLVLVVNGEFKGRLISVEPLAAVSKAQISGKVSINTSAGAFGVEHIFCLPITCEYKDPATEYIHTFAEFVSPYFSNDFLITSQPTRAPSCT